MKTHIKINPHKSTGVISPLIYGQFMEHLENCIYPAVWCGGSPLADGHGLRRDVIDVLKSLEVPLIRWPGGCFADTYDWKDGVGPLGQRPARRNWNWGGLESNRFGTDEFLSWCEQIGAQPYITLNAGTGTLLDALRWIDYCNGTLDSQDVLHRQANGRNEPYGVKFWGIGNEIWSSWEAGQMEAATYAKMLNNWSYFIKRNDPSLQLLAVGSPEGRDPDWDRTVLENASGAMRYLTTHMYAYSVDREQGDEYEAVVFSPEYFRQALEGMLRTIDESGRQAGHDIQVALDEWNIRHFQRAGEGGYQLLRSSPQNMQDALFSAGVLNAMIQLSPRIGMANHVFLLNSNGVINVDDSRVVKTPLFYVFQQYARWMRGTAVEVKVAGPTCLAPLPQLNHPLRPTNYPRRKAAYLDAAAARQDDGSLAVALINRHRDEAIDVHCEWLESFGTTEIWTLHHPDIYADNTFQTPDAVIPVTEAQARPPETIVCPAHSLVMIRCAADR